MSITIDMCLAGRDLSEPRLSPDGETVAMVVRWGGNAAISVVSASGGPEWLLTTTPAPASGRGLGGGCFDWLPDGSGVVYAAKDGNLWMQPITGGGATRLTNVGEGEAFAAPACSSDGAVAVAVLDQAGVYEVAVSGQDAEGLGARLDDGSADFVIDPYVTSCGSTVLWTAWNVPDMPWDAARVEWLERLSGERGTCRGDASIHQPRTLVDGRGLTVRDDTGWLNVWLGDEPLVDEPCEHAGPSWGMGQRSFAVSPDHSRVAFTRNEAGFGRLCVVTIETGDVVSIGRGVHGQLSWHGERLVALRSGARTPTQVVSYNMSQFDSSTDRPARTVLAVGPVVGWEAADLPEPETFTVSRGGCELHARRYVAGNGRTLCWVHGGPTDQWQVEFKPRIAYWWAQGWDILVVDPRGTTGHGRNYQNALHGEWGRLDVADTAALIAQSHAAGFSTPERTVIIGSSSGGLTVLGVLAEHSQHVAGGVALYPVADLAVLAEKSHRFEAHYTIHLVGPLDNTALYAERSPVNYAAKITKPLLLMHGDSDPIVPVESSIEMAAALREAGGDVEFHMFIDEGHGFRRPENKRRDFELTASFLHRVVGDTMGG